MPRSVAGGRGSAPCEGSSNSPLGATGIAGLVIGLVCLVGLQVAGVGAVYAVARRQSVRYDAPMQRSVMKCAVAMTCFLIPFSGFGALEWERDEVEFERKAADASLEVRYRYKNSGVTAVVIKNVEASCNCTTAEVSKTAVGPGESGELLAVFTFGKRVGLQRKKIVVETDDQQVKELRFKVQIADRVKVEPQALTWAPGEARATRKVMVYAQDGYRIPQIRAVPTDARLSAVVKTVKAGEVYEVEVMLQEPKVAAEPKAHEPFTAKLRVETGYGTPLAGVQIIPVAVE